jgi:ParB/RepB/Spo0J family partition protein
MSEVEYTEIKIGDVWTDPKTGYIYDVVSGDCKACSFISNMENCPKCVSRGAEGREVCAVGPNGDAGSMAFVLRYPVPNEYGVYDKDKAEVLELHGGKPRKTAKVFVLQIGIDQWISANESETPESGFGGPLCARFGVYETRYKALYASFDALLELFENDCGSKANIAVCQRIATWARENLAMLENLANPPETESQPAALSAEPIQIYPMFAVGDEWPCTLTGEVFRVVTGNCATCDINGQGRCPTTTGRHFDEHDVLRCKGGLCLKKATSTPKTESESMTTKAKAKKPEAARDEHPVQQCPTDIIQIQLDQVADSPFQVRAISGTPELDAALMDLAANIKQHGLINPVTVRPLAAGGVECVAGHRRLAAARLAGLETISATVLRIPDSTAEEILVSENLFRQDLTPIEESKSVCQLLKTRSIPEVAKLCQKSERWVYRRASIDKLSDDWKMLAERFKLSAAFCEAIARLTPDLQQVVIDDEIETIGDENCTTANDLIPDKIHSGQTVLEAGGNCELLAASIERKMKLLSNRPWAEYCPGYCEGCIKRTDVQPELWGESTEEAKPRCLDAECWDKKLVRWLVEAPAAYEVATGKKLLSVASKCDFYKYSCRCEPDETFSMPILVPAGMYEAGSIRYTSSDPEALPPPDDGDEGEQDIPTEEQIQQWAFCHAVTEYLGKLDSDSVDSAHLNLLFITFGVNPWDYFFEGVNGAASPERLESLRAMHLHNSHVLHDQIWRSFRKAVLLRYVRPQHGPESCVMSNFEWATAIVGTGSPLIPDTQAKLDAIHANAAKIAKEEAAKYKPAKKQKKGKGK